jgi:hypothetical protein
MLELPKRHATRTSLEGQPAPSRTALASPGPWRCHWGYQEENQKSEGSWQALPVSKLLDFQLDSDRV